MNFSTEADLGFSVHFAISSTLHGSFSVPGDLKVQLLSDYASVITNGVSACEVPVCALEQMRA
eukprot:2820370-Amphidinium_carterae.1